VRYVDVDKKGEQQHPDSRQIDRARHQEPCHPTRPAGRTWARCCGRVLDWKYL